MTELDTPTPTPRAPDAPVVQPRLGPVGWLRWIWRQLTSMRVALLLLLLLAVAAVPGSVLPQRSLDVTRTAQWITDHPTAGPLLDRLGFFEVYASPWFAAIYLMLFVSLVGCVLPRARTHARVLRMPPPRAPRRLERLPAHGEVTVAASEREALAAARAALRAGRYRVHAHDDSSLSAERGYLKELGNIVFHLALIGVLIGVAIGYLWGWKADVILPVGKSFVSTPSRYDTPINAGPWVDTENLQPFTLTLDRLDVTFETASRGAGQFGMPRDFTAHVTYAPRPDAPAEQRLIEVNGPLETGTATVFLLGNGYAPQVTVKNSRGEVLFRDAVPFLPNDPNYRSAGAIKVPAADPQLGLAGLFLPTGVINAHGPQSIFPQAVDPRLALTAFEGELFPGGRPQSVFTLDTGSLTALQNAEGTDQLRLWMKPGETVQLPGGRGSVTFDGVVRWAGLSVREDPGKMLVLVSALLSLAGLIVSLLVRRRRVFVRVSGAPEGSATVVTLGGLAKDDDDGMADEITAVLDRLRERLQEKDAVR